MRTKCRGTPAGVQLIVSHIVSPPSEMMIPIKEYSDSCLQNYSIMNLKSTMRHVYTHHFFL